MRLPQSYLVIIVAQQAIVRVDLRHQGTVEVLRTLRFPRDEHHTLASAVQAALAQGPKQRGRLLVLSDEFWSGPISLANEVVREIQENELAQSLAFEAEFESGISPFDGSIAFTPIAPLDGQPRWWVVQSEPAQTTAIKSAAADHRTKLVGYTTITRPVPDSNEFALGSPDLESDDQCNLLAKHWLTDLLSKTESAPIIRCAQPHFLSRQPWVAGILISLLAGGSCAALHLKGLARLREMKQEEVTLSKDIQQSKQQLAFHQSETARQNQLHQERDHLQKTRRRQLQNRSHDHAMYSEVRSRPGQLLRALAETTRSGHWIQQVDFDRQQVLVSGLAIDCDAVIHFVEQFEAKLDSNRWQVQPAKISNLDQLPLVHFEMTATAISSLGTPLASAPSFIPPPGGEILER